MKKTFLFTFIIGGLSLTLVQCKKENLQATPIVLEGITYADVEPIFSSNCSCHLAGGSAVGKANLSTYDNAKNNGNLEKAIRGEMYSYFKDDATKYQQVYSWIKTGRAK